MRPFAEFPREGRERILAGTGQSHGGARRVQRPGDRPANTAGRAGHQRALAGQVEHMDRSSFNLRRGPHPSTDRKSVVSGKSVSVRVALGGRRIMQKKTIMMSMHSAIIQKDTEHSTIETII